MPNEKHGIGRKAWLFIAADEGAWSAADAAKELGTMVEPVRMSLSQGAKRGFYQRLPGNPARYFVTIECKVPFGIKLGEVPQRHAP